MLVPFGPPALRVLVLVAPVTPTMNGAGFRQVAGVPMAASRSLQTTPDPGGRKAQKSEESRSSQNSSHHGHEVKSPEKPMNARDRVPARINTSPMFRATAGTSESSICSRREAMRTRARVTPAPAPRA